MQDLICVVDHQISAVGKSTLPENSVMIRVAVS